MSDKAPETAPTVSGAQMPSKLAQYPGRIRLEKVSGEVVASLNGTQIARSGTAIRLHEGDYTPVLYIPRTDADMDVLEATDHSTYCPFKGEASYFSVTGAGDAGANAVWTYEDPFVEIAGIKDHLAFYTDRVDVREV